MVVYKITNQINGKIYIGCTINYERRIKAHKSCKYAGALLLHRAFLKHGVNNFVFEIVECYATEEEMFLGEIKHIKSFNSIDPLGYNLHYGGKGGKIQLTEKQTEAKKLFAKSLTHIHIGNKYNLGRIATDKTREILSKKLKGKPKSEEAKFNISKSKLGNTYAKGVKRTEEYKKKMSESLKGRKFSEEQKRKLSESAKKRVLNNKRKENGRFVSSLRGDSEA